MRVARYGAVAVLLLLCAAPPQAAPLERLIAREQRIDIAQPPAGFSTVNRLLRDAKCIRADFSEQKSIRVLKQPLSSSGSLVYSAELGLWRAASKPFLQQLLVTPRGIAQRDEHGKVERLSIEAQPLAKGFVDAFLLVFSGRDKELAEQFELYFAGAEQHWRLGFVPRRKPLSKFIASMEISGTRGTIETLDVLEVNGDRTVTRFTNVVTDAELSPDERKQRFGWQD